ncbi:MAG: GNAT family N-acetyltransferase [Atopobiaceae bacterium]|nr:GNAT family N-acetyltransferase [Atopobiaceae bacterium]
MTIRTMQETDYPQVRALWESCKGMGLNDVDDSFEGIARFLERNPTTCLVAEEKGQVIGAIMVGYDGRRANIYHTAVSPSRQGRGVGRALVEAVLERLGELGATKASLVVFSRNEAGNAFWEHLGFGKRTDITHRDRVLVEMTRLDT